MSQNTVAGQGDRRIANDLYESAILCEVRAMRKDGTFVCLANIQRRMSDYHQDILTNTFWALAIQGRI